MNIKNIKRAEIISRLLNGIGIAKEQIKGFTGDDAPHNVELVLRCESSHQILILNDLITRHRFRALIEEELKDLEAELLDEAKKL